jgi:hypothetical protein
MLHLFGKPQYSEQVTLGSISRLFDKVLRENPAAVLIFCCDQPAQNLVFFNDFLSTIPVKVFGGVFPNIVFGEQVMEQGIILVPVHTPIDVHVYPSLKSAHSRSLTFDFELEDYRSLLVLVDGLARNIDFALNQLFQHFGQSLSVFGGGAGSLSFEQKPCLFTNQGLVADAMLVVVMQQEWELAIGHGWEILEGPFLANQVDDNRILQLNFQPAVQLYKDVVEQHDGRLFENNEFFELAKTYPFGLERLDDDVLVRDPVTIEEDSLVCVGKVPENAMLYILKGESKNLITAAVSAVENTVNKQTPATGLLFDCISRKLFLQDEFDLELGQMSAVLGSKSPLVGALVLGEIASGLSGAIHFHNKTAVMAVAISNQQQEK